MTTVEEVEAFLIVKAIVRSALPLGASFYARSRNLTAAFWLTTTTGSALPVSILVAPSDLSG